MLVVLGKSRGGSAHDERGNEYERKRRENGVGERTGWELDEEGAGLVRSSR